MKKLITVISLLVFVPMFSIASEAADFDTTKTVERFVLAFNQRDINTMLEIASPDMRWMSVSGDAIALETTSSEDLRVAMQSYFTSIPSAKSVVRSVNASGSFVYALEEASWLSEGMQQSQCSMAVYEFNSDKIQNVWYFPSHQCK